MKGILFIALVLMLTEAKADTVVTKNADTVIVSGSDTTVRFSNNWKKTFPAPIPGFFVWKPLFEDAVWDKYVLRIRKENYK